MAPWFRRRKGSDEAERELEELEHKLLEYRARAATREHNRRYASQTLTLYSVLAVGLMAVVLFVWGGPDGLALSPGALLTLKAMIGSCGILVALFLKYLVDLVYRRAELRAEFQCEDLRNRKKEILGQLKDQTHFNETMRVLQRFDESEASQGTPGFAPTTPGTQPTTPASQIRRRHASQPTRQIPSVQREPLATTPVPVAATPNAGASADLRFSGPGSLLLNRLVDFLSDGSPVPEQDEEIKALRKQLGAERARRAAAEAQLARVMPAAEVGRSTASHPEAPLDAASESTKDADSENPSVSATTS